jgi:hypothetical protein
MVNHVLHLGIAIETILGIVTSYVYWIGIGIFTRPVAQPHFMVPAFSYFCIIVYYDECRKYFLREGRIRDPETGKVKFVGWVTRNTFY